MLFRVQCLPLPTSYAWRQSFRLSLRCFFHFADASSKRFCHSIQTVQAVVGDHLPASKIFSIFSSSTGFCENLRTVTRILEISIKSIYIPRFLNFVPAPNSGGFWLFCLFVHLLHTLFQGSQSPQSASYNGRAVCEAFFSLPVQAL